jgi:hypothetical protein
MLKGIFILMRSFEKKQIHLICLINYLSAAHNAADTIWQGELYVQICENLETP